MANSGDSSFPNKFLPDQNTSVADDTAEDGGSDDNNGTDEQHNKELDSSDKTVSPKKDEGEKSHVVSGTGRKRKFVLISSLCYDSHSELPPSSSMPQEEVGSGSKRVKASEEGSSTEADEARTEFDDKSMPQEGSPRVDALFDLNQTYEDQQDIEEKPKMKVGDEAIVEEEKSGVMPSCVEMEEAHSDENNPSAAAVAAAEFEAEPVDEPLIGKQNADGVRIVRDIDLNELPPEEDDD